MSLSSTQTAAGEKSSVRGWSGRTRGGVFGNWVFITLIRGVGLYPAYFLLMFVALYFVGCAPAARRASIRYLARVGLVSGSILSWYAGTYRHFYAYGITLVDRIAVLSGITKRFSFEFEGEDEIRAALARGKGLVLLGAHFGNWEIAAHLLAGLNVTVNILLFEGERERVQRVMGSVFRDRKWRLIAVDGTGNETFEALAALRNGEVVAILADRAIAENEKGQTLVPFLGKDAYFPIGPHLLAAAAGAGIIHAFAARTRLFHYRFYVYPAGYPVLTSRANRQQDLRGWVELFVTRVESLVRQHPLQWNNFFDFWREDAR